MSMQGFERENKVKYEQDLTEWKIPLVYAIVGLLVGSILINYTLTDQSVAAYYAASYLILVLQIPLTIGGVFLCVLGFQINYGPLQTALIKLAGTIVLGWGMFIGCGMSPNAVVFLPVGLVLVGILWGAISYVFGFNSMEVLLTVFVFATVHYLLAKYLFAGIYGIFA